jgi:hypothetical protein
MRPRMRPRVLDLLPEWPGTPIKCRLHVVSFAKDPPPAYEALSYAWGLSTEGKAITLYNRDVSYTVAVTDNLFAALKGIETWLDSLTPHLDRRALYQPTRLSREECAGVDDGHDLFYSYYS